MGQHDDDIVEMRETVTPRVSREIKRGHLGAWRSHYRPATKEAKALDRMINRKLDIFVVFVLAIDFILQGLDKTNAQFAAESSSFPKHARLKKSDPQTAFIVFTAGFVILQPFSTAVSRWIGCREWISAQLAVWGVLAMAHAAIRNRMTFFVLRFFLGATEAGFIPSALFFLSNIYPKEYIGFRVGLFTGLYSFSNAVSGMLATAVMKLDPDGIHNWQVLFLLEGGLTVAMAFMSFWILPSSRGTAWMLSPDEREHALRRMNEDVNQPDDFVDSRSWLLQDFTDTIKDWRKIIISVCTIFVIVPLWSFFSIMPLVAKGLGFTGSGVSLMIIPPFLVGVISLVICTTISDRLRDRSALIIVVEIVGLVGLIVLIEAPSAPLRYVFIFISLSGALSGGPLIVCWLIDNSPLAGPRNLALGFNGWANIAVVIANELFMPKYAQQMFRYPLKIATILLTVSLCGVVLIRISYMKVNSNRRELTADWTEEQIEAEERSTERRGIYKHTYLYGL